MLMRIKNKIISGTCLDEVRRNKNYFMFWLGFEPPAYVHESGIFPLDHREILRIIAIFI